MRKAWNTFKIRIVCSLLVGALAITLCLVSTMLQNGYLQLGTYFAGMFATAVFIGLSVWLSVLIWSNWGTRGTSPTVIGTLLSALRRDPDPRVRLEAAKGLAELDVERSSLHKRHRELDEALVSALGIMRITTCKPSKHASATRCLPSWQWILPGLLKSVRM